MTALEPDREQIEIFCDAVFRYAGSGGYISMRAFYEDDSSKPFRITAIQLNGNNLKFLVDAAENDAREAAQSPKPVVFCPPLAVFANRDRARKQDVAGGLALSVECDEEPGAARTRLEELLGPATIVVKSGGIWTAPDGTTHDKLHLHWRLSQPAAGEALARLESARDIATRIVGGDPTNMPVCHPIRWPGSWHRKAEPRLCTIDTANPDIEIELDAALAALTAAAPAEEPREAQDKGSAGNGKEIEAIISGHNLHAGIATLAARLAAYGMTAGGSVKLLRDLMGASRAPHDDRWRERYDDIPRAVKTAREKFAAESNAVTWLAPVPLPDGLLPVAAFEPDFLPETVAPWCLDIADRMQCPLDFVGIAALAALGGVLGRRSRCAQNSETTGPLYLTFGPWRSANRAP